MLNMIDRKQCILWVTLFSTPLFLAGCSVFGPEPDAVAFVDSTEFEGVVVHQTGSVGPYYRATVDRIEINTPKGIGINPETQTALSDQFRRELVSRLMNDYDIVDSGGFKVLRVQTKVYNAQEGAAMGLGGAMTETVISDSVTGQLLLTIRDTRELAFNINTKYATDWEAARDVMILWSDAIRYELQEAGD